MRFSGRDANRIASGRKTECRLPRLNGEEPFEVGRILPITVMVSNPDLGYSRRNPSRPRKEGHTHCYVRILEVQAALLHEAGELGARAEGHNGFEELVRTWWERHKTGCGLPGSVEFPIEVPVWVLRFELDTSHRPRLLAKASDVNRGYTESLAEAVPDEEEAVEDQWLDRFSMESDQDKLRRLACEENRIKQRALEDRLAAVRAAALESNVNISSQLRVIERQLQKAEGRLLGQPKKAA